MGLDPFNVHYIARVFGAWVVLFGSMCCALSVHNGGLSFGPHVDTVNVETAMGLDKKHFLEMTTFINDYYPTSDSKKRTWLSMAELGLSKALTDIKDGDKGFKWGTSQMLKTYTYHTNRTQIIVAGHLPVTTPKTLDATPFYALANTMFRLKGSTDPSISSHANHDISSFRTCFIIVNVMQDALFVSWVLLLVFGLLAVANSLATGSFRSNITKRIDAVIITAINVLNLTVWGVSLNAWMTGAFNSDLCGHMMHGHISMSIGWTIFMTTLGMLVTAIYVSAAYYHADETQDGDALNSTEKDKMLP